MFEKISKTGLKVLEYIAKKPYTKIHLRELTRQLNISPSSANKSINELQKMNLIKEEKIAHLRIIFGNMDEILFKQFKILLNIEEANKIISKIKPSTNIILFGSYSRGENDELSDIDLVVIQAIKKRLKIESKNNPVQIHTFTPAQWSKQEKENKAFVKEVRKGIVLKGMKI